MEKYLTRENLAAANTQREGSGVPGATTLFGRLGQALKSDTYGDFHLGQLTQANIVAVSGYFKVALPKLLPPGPPIPLASL